MSDFLAALGLAFVIEGVLYAAFPTQMKEWLQRVATLPTSQMRGVALGCAAAGLALLFFVRG